MEQIPSESLDMQWIFSPLVEKIEKLDKSSLQTPRYGQAFSSPNR
jgi:hypothetical protein